MANTKASALTSYAAQLATGDLIPFVDISDSTQAASGTTKRVAAIYFALTAGASTVITGGGTIALGGFTLTVPATGTVALLAASNTFTGANSFAPSATNAIGVYIGMPTSTSTSAILAAYNGTTRARLNVAAADTLFALDEFDNGSNTGCRFVLGRNNHSGTQAPGFVFFQLTDGNYCPLWADTSGNIRTAAVNTQPVSGTTGTVVGTQTSSADAKNIRDVLPDAWDAVRGILYAARHGLRAWDYKTGAYNHEFFPNGLVTDLAPRYGMDRDSDHPAGKSLNIPVAIGDLMATVAVILEKLGIRNEEDLKSWLH